jgi:DNA-binding protein HU-beta
MCCGVLLLRENDTRSLSEGGAKNGFKSKTGQKEAIMTKSDLIAGIANKSNLTKADAEKALNSFVEITKDTLKQEGRLALAGLGSFIVSERKERQGRNPQTGEMMTIRASKTVRFRAGKALKESL